MPSNLSFFLGIILGILFCGISYTLLLTNESQTKQVASNSNSAPAADDAERKPEINEKYQHKQHRKVTFATPLTELREKVNDTELMETIQAERRATLKEACRRLRNKNVCPSKINGINNRLFYSKNYKLASCDVPKCGYKSWLEGMFTIEGQREHYLKIKNDISAIILGAEAKFRLRNVKDKNLRQNLFDDALKVMLVRHPFSRLVSAYYDKMVPTSSGYTYIFGPISRNINKNYRHLRHNVKERNQTDDGNATFEDFVNFLVRLKNFDDHWKSFRHMCNPCSSQYDYIAKFETLNNDMEYLKQKINLTEEHRKYFFPKGNFATNFDLMKKTFEKVPNELAHRLYEVYKEDFEVFGYRLPEWMC